MYPLSSCPQDQKTWDFLLTHPRPQDPQCLWSSKSPSTGREGNGKSFFFLFLPRFFFFHFSRGEKQSGDLSWHGGVSRKVCPALPQSCPDQSISLSSPCWGRGPHLILCRPLSVVSPTPGPFHPHHHHLPSLARHLTASTTLPKMAQGTTGTAVPIS